MSHQVEAPGREGFARFLPVAEWIGDLDRPTVARDALAGVFLAILLIPQAVAYAFLADLPPSVGFITAIVAPVVYAVFGTSRFLSLGPVALVSLLTGDAIARASETTGAAPEAIALTLALMIGVLLVALGLLRLGQVADFVSQPVLDGFTAAAALLIITSQLRHLLGVDSERGGSFFASLRNIWRSLSEVNAPTLVIGLSFLALLPILRFVLGRLLKRIGIERAFRRLAKQTVALVLLGLALVSVMTLDLRDEGVAVVGEIGIGLPDVGIPPLGYDLLRVLLPSALTIAMVILMVSQAIAKALAGQRRQKIDADQELIALGMANAAVSFVGGYPPGGSLSRSALASEAGGKTPAASAVAALILVVVATFAGPVFTYLPKAALAALIIVAVFSFLDVKGAVRTWRFSRYDGAVLAATFLTVLCFGPDSGLVAGALFGLVAYLWQTSRPRIVIEGPAEDGEHFRDQDRCDVSEASSRFLILRVDRSLYFGNVRFVQQTFLETLADRPEVDHLILDLSGVGEIDSTALDLLESMADGLEAAGVGLCLVAVKTPLFDRLAEVGFIDRIGRERVFESVHLATETIDVES